MKTKFDKIFFDLDGTISNSYQGIENGILFAMKAVNGPQLDKDHIKGMIGEPLNKSLNKYLNNEVEILKVVNLFRSYYEEKGIYESEIYQGIKELLNELHDKSSLYIISAKPSFLSVKLLEYHGIISCFTNILGYDLGNKNFSKSTLLKQFEPLAKSIIIGDKKQDIIAGIEAKIKTAGVLYGYGSRQEIINSGPDYVINSVAELRNLLIFQ